MPGGGSCKILSRRPSDLSQLGVLGRRGDEDGNIRVGVFPEGQEIVIGSPGFDDISDEHVSTREAEMSEHANLGIQDDAGMIEDFLKLGGCGGAVVQMQVYQPTNVCGT
jgi:hypothetical protein